MSFEWNAEKERANIKKYGVNFVEASPVFGGPFERIIPDSDHSFEEHRFLSLGISSGGRAPVVASTERVENRTASSVHGPEYDFTADMGGKHHRAYPFLQYRFATSGNYSSVRCQSGLEPQCSVSALTGRDYVETRYFVTGDSPCLQNPTTPMIAYMRTTLPTNRATLTEASGSSNEGTYTVALKRQPSGAVTVSVAGGGMTVVIDTDTSP